MGGGIGDEEANQAKHVLFGTLERREEIARKKGNCKEQTLASLEGWNVFLYCSSHLSAWVGTHSRYYSSAASSQVITTRGDACMHVS